MYGETEEPSASMVVPDNIFQVSTQDLAGYLSFRPKLFLQDPSGIMAVRPYPEALPDGQLGKDSPDLLEGGVTPPETGTAGPADDAAPAPVVPMFGFRRKTSMGF